MLSPFLFKAAPGEIAACDTTKRWQLKIHQSYMSIVNYKTNPLAMSTYFLKNTPTLYEKKKPAYLRNNP